jgi:uncharacterized protein (DUF488 family)
MTLYTIGFTGKTARQFFGLLQRHRVRTLIDIRLNNRSQLSAFAKREDLEYFLEAIARISYEHRPSMAPTEELLAAYKKKQITWDEYAARFGILIRERRIEMLLSPPQAADACLLCSEHLPAQCHRRLVAEYLRDAWADAVGLDIVHLK